MESVKVDSLATPDLEMPVLVEGLPGVGHVGRVTANYLVDEFDSQPVRRMYSPYFPPVLSVDDDGSATLAALTIHAVDAGERELLVATGYGQADDPVGQYHITEAILDAAEEFGVSEVFALGGAIAGEPEDAHDVVGAVGEDSDELKEPLERAGVSYRGADAPETIGGVSGLLLGFGPRRGMPAASILGTTRSPKRPDPGSASAVLESLQELLGFSIDLSSFDTWSAETIDGHEMSASSVVGAAGADDNLRYFG